MSTFNPTRLLAAIALAGASIAAHAGDVTLSGHLTYNTDVVQIQFTLANAGSVSLWTDSWMAGLNFDPTLSVFDAASQLVVTGDDTADPALLHTGQGGYDSEIDLPTLAAGQYTLTLSASGNDPLGNTLADGFSLQGSTPILIADWNQPSYDINKNDQKGDFWQVHLSGVDTPVPAVPEPGTYALMALGLAGLAAVARRQR